MVGNPYTYDKNGNQLTFGTLTNTFDYANKLTKTVNGSITTRYDYDHTGSRTTKTTAGVPTFYPTSRYTADTGTCTNTHHIYLGPTMLASVEIHSNTPTYHFTHTDQITGSNVTSDSNGKTSLHFLLLPIQSAWSEIKNNVAQAAILV